MSEQVNEPHRGIVVLSRRMKLHDDDLMRLRMAGYIPLIGNPDHIKVVQNFSELSGDEITVAALKVCAMNGDRHRQFGEIILKSMIARIEEMK